MRAKLDRSFKQIRQFTADASQELCTLGATLGELSIRTLTLAQRAFYKSVGYAMDRLIKLAPRDLLVPTNDRSSISSPLRMAGYRVCNGDVRCFKLFHVVRVRSDSCNGASV